MSDRRHAFTLLEIVVVIAILAVLAGMVVPLIGESRDKANDDAVLVSLNNLRNIILGTPDRPGFRTDTLKLPDRIADLVVNPFAGLPASNPDSVLAVWQINSKLGWRGPYVQNPGGNYFINGARGFTAAYGLAGDPAVSDPWGNPIVLQYPSDAATTDAALKREFVRLVSAGLDGIITTSPDELHPTTRGDDFVLFLNRADVTP